MTALTQLAGQRFACFLVLRRAPDLVQRNGRRRTAWHCLCDCGAERVVRTEHLVSGRSQSCGCRKPEMCRAANVTHGHIPNRRPTPEYQSWRGMKGRCLDLKHIGFARYGGRGGKLFEGWANDIEAFVAEMGTRPAGATLCR